jgi:hypothetical protein
LLHKLLRTRYRCWVFCLKRLFASTIFAVSLLHAARLTQQMLFSV